VSAKLQSIRDIQNLQRDRKGWYRIENAASTTADVYIYGYIGWDVTADEFVKELRGVTAKSVNVHIATDGGDVTDGIAILNALRAMSADVTTIVDSQAYSAGSFILQAGKTRKMMPNSSVMIHDASSGVLGNAKDMREAADFLDGASNNIASIYAQRSGTGDVESWRAVMEAETWYTADQAVEAGLADEVVDLSPATKNYNKVPAVVNKAPDGPTIDVTDSAEQFVFDPELFRKALQEVYK
jgi:ATP-dependent Clp endopeptidase proteolytic subunit ClpP